MECSGFARRHTAQRHKQAGVLRVAALTVTTAATLAVSGGPAAAGLAKPGSSTEGRLAGPGNSTEVSLGRQAGLIAGLGKSAGLAAADPGKPGGSGAPSVQDLKQEATKAQNQFETLTEQYNGLRVQLDQATRAQQVAQDEADRAQAAYQVVQKRIGQLAASSYMHAGGVDPAIVLLTSRNPAALLDQASTLNYFATQSGTQAHTLAQALLSAVRTRKAAQSRASEVEALRALIDQKRRTLTQLYNADRDKIAKQDPTQLVNLPLITEGSSSKALEALQWALRERGKPYVWGAAGPGSFDCSGLTMWAYSKVGINLPHYTGSQWNSGTHISKDQLRPGDLVFFYPDLHHMGMYIGNGMIVHAPHTGDVVRVAPLAGRPFAGAVRVA